MSLQSIFGLVENFKIEIMQMTNGGINHDNIKNFTLNESIDYINQYLSSIQNEYDEREREKSMKK
jgi:hypothetical protein